MFAADDNLVMLEANQFRNLLRSLNIIEGV